MRFQPTSRHRGGAASRGCSGIRLLVLEAGAGARGRGPPQALWGDMKPIVSVKELMQDMIHPASDFIFDSVSTVI